jgi:hypothetical protein
MGINLMRFTGGRVSDLITNRRYQKGVKYLRLLFLIHTIHEGCS